MPFGQTWADGDEVAKVLVMMEAMSTARAWRVWASLVDGGYGR
jgi:hypothetical protein